MLSLLIGCFFGGNGGRAKDTMLGCTDMAVASTNVVIQDAAGNAITGATVTYSVDGIDQGECENMNGTYVCGWEQAGEFVITAEAAGFVTNSIPVTVEQTEDGCHVVGEQVTLTLTPDSPDCTENIVYSLYVHVTTDAAIPIQNETVMWGLANADMAPQPCEPDGDHYWRCAQEMAGDLDIYVSAENFVDAYQIVTVGMDAQECHVVTENVEVSLTPQ